MAAEVLASDVDWQLPARPNIRVVIHGQSPTIWHHLVSVINITAPHIPLAVRVARLHALYAVHRHLKGADSQWVLCALNQDQYQSVTRLCQEYERVIATKTVQLDETQWQRTPLCPICVRMRGVSRVHASTCIVKCIHRIIRCATCQGALWMGRLNWDSPTSCGRYECAVCHCTLCVKCWAHNRHQCQAPPKPS